MFQGAKYTREWDFSKLIGVESYSDQPATVIQVSNRQKTSGIQYAGLAPEPVRLKLAVAVAMFQGENEQVAKELHQALTELDAGGAATITNLFPGAGSAEGRDAVS